ncbi:pyrroline-5-carboxylate reductase family protein [Bacteroidota bacterium]
MDMKTGIIGGGRITRIFLQALKNNHESLNRFSVFDVNNEVTERLKSQFSEIDICSLDTTASQDVVIIALHPPVIVETLDKIKANIKDRTQIVSFAPKITIAKISDTLGGITRIIRMIPNAPSIIGKGYNPACFSEAFSEEEKKEYYDFFSPMGETLEVEESKLEAYAITAAMGPTYLWFQLYKLAELSIDFGLNKNETSDAIKKMVSGSVDTMFSEYTKEEVLDLIPVKPIGDHEAEILNAYDTKLNGLYNKLKS